MAQSSSSRVAREAAIAAMERVRLLLEALDERDILKETLAAAHRTIHEATAQPRMRAEASSGQGYDADPIRYPCDMDAPPALQEGDRARRRLN